MPIHNRTGEIDHFFHMLGLDISIFTIWARSKLKTTSIECFLEVVHSQYISAHKLIQIVGILAHREPLHAPAGEQAVKARALIEAEDDVTYRASLFAGLGRAMLPASIDEASAYFRYGLEQMDAIGSGDCQFTNELLLFASTMKGNELDECDFHTLTNICELNMGEEPEKFFWGVFARGLSKAAGMRGLAKLSRWDDRSKISLDNTLLPYLTALVEDGKIDIELALALNRLAEPVEYHENGTKEFAKSIQSKGGVSKQNIISELIKQYQDNNPGVSRDTTIEVLASLAKETFGRSSETTYLAAAQKCFAKVIDRKNYHMNYRSKPDAQMRKRTEKMERENREALKEIVATTDPADQYSLAKAAGSFEELRSAYELKDVFFESLRKKVPFNARATYIKNTCALEDFNLYWKLEELKVCKGKWGHSSAALEPIFAREAIPLLQRHADDLVRDNSLSGYNLSEISNLTGVHISELIIELIKVFSREDASVSGSVWLAFASHICSEADDGQGQLALQRLLQSDAAKLAGSVADGAWTGGLYPENDKETIAAGLIWRMLGSPSAEHRWRAAHSIRCLARFGRWEVVDALVGRLDEESAGSFQAEELPFYYLHARLWLLIALARIAIDYPKEIARYKDILLRIASVGENPHALMRHFAACALIACIDGKCLKLKARTEQQLRAVDLSPYPLLKTETLVRRDSYGGRPESVSKPKFNFNLDYDFRKYEVDSLGRAFGKSCWEVEDLISGIVRQIDPNVSSMYETGGRESRYRQSSRGITTRFHMHGQQLGWHALSIAAGKLLASSQVINERYYDDDPWEKWLGGNILTREDGFWMSDGLDRVPLDTAQILQETAKDGLMITGNREKLLQLVGINSRVRKELVVEGRWHSSDDIRVSISSALVPRSKAAKLTRKLIREDPMIVWLPKYGEYEDEDEFLRSEMKEYTPWIVCPDREARLDEHDPFGARCVNYRPRLATNYASALSLTSDDHFGRVWKNKRGATALRAEAWGREDIYSEGGPYSGLRLFCSSSTLKKVLQKSGKDLLVLINLQKYEEGLSGESSKYTHTVAVVQISNMLDFQYFKGRINHVYKPRY